MSPHGEAALIVELSYFGAMVRAKRKRVKTMETMLEVVSIAVPAVTPHRALLEQIIRHGQVQVVFQPIVHLGDGELYGFEALVRGPSDSILHSPVMLFEEATRCGMSGVLDLVCIAAILREFSQRKLPGTLFVNVIPDTLLSDDVSVDALLGMLSVNDIRPDRIVLELTETRPNATYPVLRQVAEALRNTGVRLALDDLGEGFSNLRLWSELRPDVVKLDKYLVQNIHTDLLKEQFVRSLVDMARASGAILVAEGIEQPEELLVLRDLGVAMGQGYLIARPNANPAACRHYSLPRQRQSNAYGRRRPVARDLLQDVPYLSVESSCEQAYQMFAGSPQRFAIPVVKGGRPVGLLTRHHVLETFAKPFSRELYAKKSCMALADLRPLIVPADIDIQALSGRVVEAEQRYLVDGFVIVDDGCYLGMGTGYDLMRVISEMQLSAARYANPLTGLPGNVPISEEVQRLLDGEHIFVVAYVDLDYFKPFNDQYGYGAGDDLIRELGRLLLSQVDPAVDFVGHIGGDDFVLLLQSCNWQARLQTIIQLFDRQVLSFFSEADRRAGGYEIVGRTGQLQFFPLTSVSIGVLQVMPSHFVSHYEVASAATQAKKMAKKQEGSSLFIEQRQFPALAQRDRLAV